MSGFEAVAHLVLEWTASCGSVDMAILVENQVHVMGRCPITEKEWTVKVPVGQFIAWRQGRHAQDAFTDLQPWERELLITGTSVEGWDILFGEEEE